jgi:hypothetical protein
MSEKHPLASSLPSRLALSHGPSWLEFTFTAAPKPRGTDGGLHRAGFDGAFGAAVKCSRGGALLLPLASRMLNINRRGSRSDSYQLAMKTSCE